MEKLVFGIYQNNKGTPRMECNVGIDFAIRMLASVLEDMREKRVHEMLEAAVERANKPRLVTE